MPSHPDPTTINASKGFSEIINYTNTVSDGWFSQLLLLGIWIIILIGFYKAKEDFTGALAVAGFGTFIVALLFWAGGLISTLTMGVSLAFLLIGVVILWLDQ